MALASPSILVVQRAPKIGCHQCLCPQDDLLPLWEAFEDQQVGLTQDLSNCSFFSGS